MKKEATKWQKGRDIWWQDVVLKYPTTCDVEWVDAEDPLFLLYTSGSTGKPKGVLHTTGGYMIYTATTFKYAFDYNESDIYWCTADYGWIAGYNYVTYGPMLNGATVVLYEGLSMDCEDIQYIWSQDVRDDGIVVSNSVAQVGFIVLLVYVSLYVD